MHKYIFRCITSWWLLVRVLPPIGSSVDSSPECTAILLCLFHYTPPRPGLALRVRGEALTLTCLPAVPGGGAGLPIFRGWCRFVGDPQLLHEIPVSDKHERSTHSTRCDVWPVGGLFSRVREPLLLGYGTPRSAPPITPSPHEYHMDAHHLDSQYVGYLVFGSGAAHASVRRRGRFGWRQYKPSLCRHVVALDVAMWVDVVLVGNGGVPNGCLTHVGLEMVRQAFGLSCQSHSH